MALPITADPANTGGSNPFHEKPFIRPMERSSARFFYTTSRYSTYATGRIPPPCWRQ